ncbi:MAG: hypothetical protein ACRD02_07115 [Acidimicrobiia bacterium]
MSGRGLAGRSTVVLALWMAGIGTATGQETIACPLTEGIIVEFGERLRSDQDESAATSGVVSVSVPAGTYDVVLVSFDDSSKGQPREQWVLEGLAGSSVVFTSSASPDIPDDSDLVVATVDTGVQVPALTAARARHAAFPDLSSANSLDAVCASFVAVAPPTTTTTTTTTSTTTTTTTTVVPPSISVTVDKTNDADQDGTFSDEETLVVDPATPGLRGTVAFRAVITNTGSLDVVINQVTDAFGPHAIRVCPELEGAVLSPAGSTTCQFVIENYAPLSGATQLDTVTVAVTEAADPDNLARAEDTSVVNFVKILGPTTTSTTTVLPTTTSTAPTLPFTGPPPAGLVSGLGVGLMLASAALLGTARRLAGGVVLSSTNWLAESGATRPYRQPGPLP